MLTVHVQFHLGIRDIDGLGNSLGPVSSGFGLGNRFRGPLRVRTRPRSSFAPTKHGHSPGVQLGPMAWSDPHARQRIALRAGSQVRTAKSRITGFIIDQRAWLSSVTGSLATPENIARVITTLSHEGSASDH